MGTNPRTHPSPAPSPRRRPPPLPTAQTHPHAHPHPQTQTHAAATTHPPTPQNASFTSTLTEEEVAADALDKGALTNLHGHSHAKLPFVRLLKNNAAGLAINVLYGAYVYGAFFVAVTWLATELGESVSLGCHSGAAGVAGRRAREAIARRRRWSRRMTTGRVGGAARPPASAGNCQARPLFTPSPIAVAGRCPSLRPSRSSCTPRLAPGRLTPPFSHIAPPPPPRAVNGYGLAPPIALTITIISLLFNCLGLFLAGYGFDNGMRSISAWAATVTIGLGSSFGLYYWVSRR